MGFRAFYNRHSSYFQVADICKGRYSFFRLCFRTSSLVASMSISMFGYLKVETEILKSFPVFFFYKAIGSTPEARRPNL